MNYFEGVWAQHCHNPPLGTDVDAPPAIGENTLLEVVVGDGENSIWPGRWLRLRDGRRSGIAQTENTVRHTKYGRIRGMVVGEGGRSTGVLLSVLASDTLQPGC